MEDYLVGFIPCSLVTRYYCFGGARCFHRTWNLKIQTTRRRIPEERDLYRCEKLKSEVRYGEQRSELLLWRNCTFIHHKLPLIFEKS
jgi:hypothetical protein